MSCLENVMFCPTVFLFITHFLSSLFHPVSKYVRLNFFYAYADHVFIFTSSLLLTNYVHWWSIKFFGDCPNAA